MERSCLIDFGLSVRMMAARWGHSLEAPPASPSALTSGSVDTVAPEQIIGRHRMAERGLAKSPDLRYGSCREMVEAAIAACAGRNTNQNLPGT
ncbi:hypothetical protein BH23CHL8_BH23CHL8_07520 [soil metagenome]